jgi:hypothetical protein
MLLSYEPKRQLEDGQVKKLKMLFIHRQDYLVQGSPPRSASSSRGGSSQQQGQRQGKDQPSRSSGSQGTLWSQQHSQRIEQGWQIRQSRRHLLHSIVSLLETTAKKVMLTWNEGDEKCQTNTDRCQEGITRLLSSQHQDNKD